MKYLGKGTYRAGFRGRSPSWGAWIEIWLSRRRPPRLHRRSPSWGAWIEISNFWGKISGTYVAPPRGERGLKFPVVRQTLVVFAVAPPRGERGLKLHDVEFDGTNDAVAPPRGERGLKSPSAALAAASNVVAPPRGERGLKLRHIWCNH